MRAIVEPTEEHAYAPDRATVVVNVCRCGLWPLHHIHTGNRAACTCDACRVARQASAPHDRVIRAPRRDR